MHYVYINADTTYGTIIRTQLLDNSLNINNYILCLTTRSSMSSKQEEFGTLWL